MYQVMNVFAEITRLGYSLVRHLTFPAGVGIWPVIVRWIILRIQFRDGVTHLHTPPGSIISKLETILKYL